MKAVVQRRYGSPYDLELQDLDVPRVGDGEVLVRVHAASVHPDVWHVLCGRPYVLRFMGGGILRPRNPIPGTDMAGVVEVVGKDVDQFQVGDGVFGETCARHAWANGSAYAEFVCVRPDWLALKPPNVTFEQAAVVPSAGFIALQNLRPSKDRLAGRHVLINGAGGGVGSITLQVAKAYGAEVTGVDIAKKLPMLRQLGADQTIDFKVEDFTLGDVRYDLIVDIPGVRRLSDFKRVLKPDGRYVPIGHEGFGTSRRVLGLIPHFLTVMLLARFDSQLRGPRVPLPTRTETLAMLRALLESGDLTPVIDRAFPLSEVSDAIRHLIEGEPCGKVIVLP